MNQKVEILPTSYGVLSGDSIPWASAGLGLVGPVGECVELTGLPLRRQIERSVRRQPGLPASVGVHRVDLEVEQACAVAGEDDLGAVRRPSRLTGLRRIVRQPGEPAAIGVHRVDLEIDDAAPVARESNLAAVRRPGRADVHCPNCW